jgi:DNA-binding NarL/FixJ family response regulator
MHPVSDDASLSKPTVVLAAASSETIFYTGLFSALQGQTTQWRIKDQSLASLGYRDLDQLDVKRFVEEHVLGLCPSLFVFYWPKPGTLAQRLIHEIKQRDATIRCALIVAARNPSGTPDIRSYLASNADLVLNSDENAAVYVEQLCWLLKGYSPISIAELRKLVHAAALPSTLPSNSEIASLTPKLREMLPLIAEGLTNRQIAERQCIAVNTVNKQIESMYQKLGLSAVDKDKKRCALTGVCRIIEGLDT